MKVLRTPDERFDNLPDFPWKPHYREVDSRLGPKLRIASIEEGPADKDPILMMHGEPSWSFLYRHMIKALLAKGHRIVAPDLVGFGRSDKPSEVTDYTYERHVDWMLQWLRAADLKRVTLFCQDWGGLIGLRLVAAEPDRFARVVTANTGLPIGTGSNEAFDNWVNFSQTVPEFPFGMILNAATTRELSAAEQAAYHAPYPDSSYIGGARRFPALVPVKPDMPSVAENKKAWEVLSNFKKPWLTLFSDNDPVTKGGEKVFQERVPGTKGQPHETMKGGHFLQEDCGPELADRIDAFIKNNP
jgi:haloalkane dehalogenase